MNRRDFLKGLGAACIGLLLPKEDVRTASDKFDLHIVEHSCAPDLIVEDADWDTVLGVIDHPTHFLTKPRIILAEPKQVVPNYAEVNCDWTRFMERAVQDAMVGHEGGAWVVGMDPASADGDYAMSACYEVVDGVYTMRHMSVVPSYEALDWSLPTEYDAPDFLESLQTIVDHFEQRAQEPWEAPEMTLLMRPQDFRDAVDRGDLFEVQGENGKTAWIVRCDEEIGPKDGEIWYTAGPGANWDAALGEWEIGPVEGPTQFVTGDTGPEDWRPIPDAAQEWLSEYVYDGQAIGDGWGGFHIVVPSWGMMRPTKQGDCCPNMEQYIREVVAQGIYQTPGFQRALCHYETAKDMNV